MNAALICTSPLPLLTQGKILFHQTYAIPSLRHHTTCDVTDSFQKFR